MAWNIKYYTEWNDLHSGHRNRLEFLTEETVTTPEPIIVKSFKITYPEIDFFGEETIFGCGADIDIISSSMLYYLNSLYLVNSLGMQVRHYLLDYESQSQYLNFIGYLDTEQYEDPFSDKKNYTITVTANNGINILDRFTICDEIGNRLEGVYNALDIIKYCFEKLKISYDYINIGLTTTIPEIPFVEGENILHKLYVKTDNFYDEDAEMMTCKEVINNILLSLSAKLYIHNNSIYIMDINTLHTPYFSTPGVTALPVDGTIYCSTKQEDDKIIIGGDFTNKIVRLNYGGLSVDTTFSSTITYSVRSVAVDSNGRVWVGGTDSNVAKLTVLNEGGSTYSTITLPIEDMGSVNSICVQANGKILIGGNGLFRYNIDGTIDTSFTAEVSPYIMIYSVKTQSDNKIIIGGNLSAIRLNTDGSLDSSFTCDTSVSGYTYTIGMQSDGKILIGGDYEVVRLNTSGSLDTSFTFSSEVGEGICSHLELLSDGKIMIAGNFTNTTFAKLNADGTLNTLNIITSVSIGLINTICLLSDTIFLVGGNFTYHGYYVNNETPISVGVNLQQYIYSSLVFNNNLLLNNISTIDERIESHSVSMSPGKNKINITFNKYCYNNPFDIPISEDTLSGYIETNEIYDEDNVLEYREYIYSACPVYFDKLTYPLMTTFVNQRGIESETGGDYFVRMESGVAGAYRLRIKTDQFLTSAQQYIGVNGSIMMEDPDNVGVETNMGDLTFIPFYYRVVLLDENDNEICWYEHREFLYTDIVTQEYGHTIWKNASNITTPLRGMIGSYSERSKYNKWYNLNGECRTSNYWYGHDINLKGKTLTGIIIPLFNSDVDHLYTIPGGRIAIDIYVQANGTDYYKNVLIKDLSLSLLRKNDDNVFFTTDNTDAEFQGYISSLYKEELTIDTTQGTDLEGNSRGLYLLKVTGTYYDSGGINERYVSASNFSRGVLTAKTLEELLLSTYLSNLKDSRYLFTCNLRNYYPMFTNFEFPLLKKNGVNAKMIPISMEVDYEEGLTSLTMLEYVEDTETIDS